MIGLMMLFVGTDALVHSNVASAQAGCGWVSGFWRCGVTDTVDELAPDYDGPPVTIRATLQILDDVRLGFGNVGDPAPCILGTTELDPAGEGLLYLREAFSVATGLIVQTDFRCVGPGEPPVPPPLPSRAEIWRSTPVPQPVIHVSPTIDGLVGLDTWLWGEAHGSVTISLSLRGWSVSGTAGPTESRPATAGYYAADNPGSEGWPVGSHVFSRSGTYGITHTVGWGGGFTVTGYGFTFVVDGLATSFDSILDYDVIEIEAVLTPIGD
ncbi:MAG: hypothetical protein ACRD0A_12795 [Acidimicrobiales bacterium]